MEVKTCAKEDWDLNSNLHLQGPCIEILQFSDLQGKLGFVEATVANS